LNEKKTIPKKIFEAHLARESSENLGSTREPTFEMAKKLGSDRLLLKITMVFFTENFFDFSDRKFI